MILRAPDARRFFITSQWRGLNPERPDHRGVDFMAPWMAADPAWDGIKDKGGKRRWVTPPDTRVLAVRSGVITHAEPGLVIQSMDEFPGYWPRYVHVDDVLVKKGDRVSKGQDLAEASDVNTSVPHLHFGLRKLVGGKSTDIDPNPLLLGQPPEPRAPMNGLTGAQLLLLALLAFSILRG